MPLNGVSIVLDSLSEVSTFHIHGFYSESTLFFLQLVRQGLFHADSFEVEEGNQAFILASVAHDMVSVVAVVIDVDLVADHITNRTHFHL
jgi:hypothetical protein